MKPYAFTPFELLELSVMDWRRLSDELVARAHGFAAVSDPATNRIQRVTLAERRDKRRARRQR